MEQGTAKAPSPFLRDASGLVREVSTAPSFLAVFGLVTGGVPILWAASLYFYPGANWPVAFLIAFLPTLVMGALFSIVGMSMPRAGGDYVFTTRGTNAFVGFIFYWFIAMAFMLNNGIFAYFGAVYFGYFFSSLGVFYNNASWVSLGSQLTSPLPSLGIAALIIVIGALIAVLRPRRAWRIILVFGILSLIATAVMLISFATMNASSFAGAYDSFAGSGAYNGIISAGGVTPPSDWFVATSAALPFTWFAFTWYNLPTTWSGELKNVKRSIPISILGALVLIAAYYVLYAVLVFNAFGGSFLENWSSIAVSGSDPTVSSIGGFVPYFALIYTHNPWIFFIMFVALWLPNFLTFGPIVISQTRYVFAWAFDRILPERVASVSERLHTPVVAMVIVVLISLLGATLTDTLSGTGYTALAFAIFTFGFIGAAVAAILFPFRRKELYKNFALRKKFILPVISWLGIAALVYLVYSTILSLQTGSLPYDDPVMLPLYGGILAVGVAIYAVSYVINKRRGIPIGLVFKEIPPE